MKTTLHVGDETYITRSFDTVGTHIITGKQKNILLKSGITEVSIINILPSKEALGGYVYSLKVQDHGETYTVHNVHRKDLFPALMEYSLSEFIAAVNQRLNSK